jgi:hypothetical protein
VFSIGGAKLLRGKRGVVQAPTLIIDADGHVEEDLAQLVKGLRLEAVAARVGVI